MVNWALLSTAHINLRLMAGIDGVDGARKLAVASREQARADAYASEHGIERAYGSYEALLADPDVDIVYISLPNGMHVDWTRAALEAGKHVLCEKPLSRDPAEVVELFDLAGARGLLLSEAFMYRHNPQTITLAELLGSGAIGELRLIRGHFSFNAGPQDVRLLTDLAGGGLMDVGCYPVSMARYLAGEPVRVSAEQVLGGEGVDVVLTGTMRFPGDVLAHFDCGLAMPGRFEVEVVGSSGTLFVREPWHPGGAGIQLRHDGSHEQSINPVQQIDVPVVDSYVLEVRDLTEAVRGEHAPLLGRADAVGQARTLQALYEAAASGQTVAV